MIKKIYNLIIFLPLIVFSQQQKLLVAMDDLSAGAVSKIKSQGVGDVKVVYGDFIHSTNSNILNEKTLRQEIIRLFPDVKTKGYGMLDWEGPVFNKITGLENSDLNFNDSLNEFLKTIRLAKKLRPNVKWGFFDIPLRREFFDSENKWKTQIHNVEKILLNSDVLYTAFYKQSPTYNFSSSNLATFLELSNKYKLELLPVVWNRYDTPNKKYRHQLIAETQFRKMVTDIFNYQYKGRRVNHIVWWGRDSWFYKAYKTTVNEAKTFEEYDKKYNERVLRVINNIGRK